VIYAAILNEHAEKAVELIGDIVFHSTFPQKEIDKEKQLFWMKSLFIHNQIKRTAR